MKRKERISQSSSFYLSFIFLFFVGTTLGLSVPKSSSMSTSLSCHDLGFTETLLCSTCTDFEEFYEGGAAPRLEVTDSEGKEEKLSIDSWKTENLEEYLKDNNLQ
eukprot:gene3570-4448_t